MTPQRQRLRDAVIACMGSDPHTGGPPRPDTVDAIVGGVLARIAVINARPEAYPEDPGLRESTISHLEHARGTPPPRLSVYVSHRYGGDPTNLARAAEWFEWLRATFADVEFRASWIAHCLSTPETPEEREAGLRGCEAEVSECDAVFAVGAESAGMAREREAWLRSHSPAGYVHLCDESLGNQHAISREVVRLQTIRVPMFETLTLEHI